MTTDDIKLRILRFAQYLGQPGTAAEDFARRRGWLDQDGNPTPDGRTLVDELRRQAGTRSVFFGAA